MKIIWKKLSFSFFIAMIPSMLFCIYYSLQKFYFPFIRALEIYSQDPTSITIAFTDSLPYYYITETFGISLIVFLISTAIVYIFLNIIKKIKK